MKSRITRIDQMKQYLAEAEQDPDNNKLYIEDLKLSIELFGRSFIGKSMMADEKE
jgi:hypothetical protein